MKNSTEVSRVVSFALLPGVFACLVGAVVRRLAGRLAHGWRGAAAVMVWVALVLPASVAVAGLEVAADKLPAPHQVIEKATRDVLDRIVRDRPLFKQNPEHLYVIIEENLVPYVDFERISRRVMAKYFRDATPAQKQRFAVVFKTSLIRAYGAALAEYNDQKFVLKAPGRGDVEPTRATVNMEMTAADGTVYPLSYAMFTDVSGAWKLENLVLNGINLGLTYRNNFAELAQQYGGDLDKVITGWSSVVAEESAGKKKKAG